MANRPNFLSGSGGGGKGGGGGDGPRAAQEAPNTLQSKSLARVIDLISEGEIEGLVNGEQSIFFDNTPIANADGTKNFQGVTWNTRVGTSDQDYLEGFPEAETPVGVGTEVTFAAPVTRTIIDAGYNAIRVTLRIPSLNLQNTSNGDLGGTSVQIAIDIKTDGGSFVERVNQTISGKCVSPYERSYLISLPTAVTGWDVRMRRLTADSGSVTLQNDTFFSTYSLIVDAKFKYDDTAYIGLAVDSQLFGGQIPSRSFEIYGIKIQIPSNYYPRGPQITNKLLRSAELDNASWTKTRSSTTADNTTDPNTTTTAEKLTEDNTAGNTHLIQQSITVAANTVHATSIYVKANSRTKGRIQWGDTAGGSSGPTNGAYADFDLSVPSITAGSATGTGSVTSTEIVTVGSGWFRISLIANIGGAGTTGIFAVYLADAAGAVSYNGDNSSNFYLWGAQVVADSHLGTYIPTTTAVASGYDATRARWYIGVWDGVMKTEWSDNPAWVLYDIMSNTRYGLGDSIDATQIDKWSLYQIGRYCDAVNESGVYVGVDDGFGNKEPRFTFNYVINTREEAYRVLQSVASAFRGMLYWSTGAVFAVQDAPMQPIKLVTPSNVIGGDFQYTGTGLKARHTVAHITWNDPLDGYRPAIEIVEHNDDIQLFGLRQLDIAAYGCTSRGQARRLGKWALDSEKYETETVTYRTGFDHADTFPGDIVEISDPTYAGIRMGGRIKDYSDATPGTYLITLDAPVTISALLTYQLSIMMPSSGKVSVTNGSGTVQGTNTNFSIAVLVGDTFRFDDDVKVYTVSAITDKDTLTITPVYSGSTAGPGEFAFYRSGIEMYSSRHAIITANVLTGASATDTLSVAFTGLDDPWSLKGAVWILTASNLAPRKFRVLANREIGHGQFEITGLLHDPNKYARVEDDLFLEAVPATLLPTGQITAPTNLTVTEYLYKVGPAILPAIIVSWQAPEDSRVTLYEVQVARPNHNYEPYRTTTMPSIDIRGEIIEGTWGFRVRSLTALGVPSPTWLTTTEIIVGTESVPPADITGFNMSAVGQSVILTWEKCESLNLARYWIKYTPNMVGATWGSALTLKDDLGKEETQFLTQAASGTFLIRGVSDTGILSENAAIIVSSVSVTGFNAVDVIEEHPTWGGTHTDTVTAGSDLTLDTSGGSFVATGTYEFDSTVDLGDVYTSRVSALILAAGNNTGYTMSTWTTLSSVLSMSGADPDQWGVVCEARTTEDDPAGTPTWTAWAPLTVGDYIARGFQFRLILTSNSPSVAPLVSECTVTIDMPDRVVQEFDVAVPNTGLTVTYTPAFRATPSLLVTEPGGATGDYPVITSQSATGFHIVWKNSANVAITTTMNYAAAGFGYVT